MPHRPSEAIPCSRPEWLTPSRVATSAVVLAGLSCAAPLIVAASSSLDEAHACGAEPVLTSGVASALTVLISLSTAALSLLHARRVLSRSESSSFQLGVALGAVNGLSAATALGAIGALESANPEWLARGVIVGLVAIVPGALLGGAFGLAYAFPLRAAMRAASAPSHDAAERALVRCGLWLAIVAGAASIPDRPSVAHLLATACAWLGLGALCAGICASWQRRRFVSQVADGRVPGWELRPLGADDLASTLLPFRIETHYDAVLARTPAATSGPYRAAPGVAMALVTTRNVVR